MMQQNLSKHLSRVLWLRVSVYDAGLASWVMRSAAACVPSGRQYSERHKGLVVLSPWSLVGLIHTAQHHATMLLWHKAMGMCPVCAKLLALREAGSHYKGGDSHAALDALTRFLLAEPLHSMASCCSGGLGGCSYPPPHRVTASAKNAGSMLRAPCKVLHTSSAMLTRSCMSDACCSCCWSDAQST